MGRICVALRLRFVKLPDTDDERIFRDVLRLAPDPDDRDFDALLDIVDKKLSFMEIAASGAEVTLFCREENGDRVVIDAPYYAQLVRKWVRASRTHRRRADDRPRKRPRVEQATPLVLAQASPPPPREDDETTSTSSRGSSSSDSGSSHSDDSSPSAVPGLTETIDIEVRLRANGGHVVRERVPSATTTPTPLTTMAPAVVSASVAALPMRQRPHSGEDLTTAHSTAARPALSRVLPAQPPSMPLTATNLARVVAAAPVVSPLIALADPAAYLSAQPSSPQPVRLCDLTFPPVNPHFYVRCVILSIRVKLPKAGVVVTEMELCDAADPAVHITAVSFDEVVQRGIRENLRGDRRQVVELRNVTLRRKNELDVRYQTNRHPLQMRLERHCQIEVVQVLPIPVGAAAASARSNEPLHGGANPNVTVRATLQPNGVLDVAELAGAGAGIVSWPPPSNLSDIRGGGGGVGASSSSSSLSGGPRRTTFSFASTGGSAGSSAPDNGTGAARTAATTAYAATLGQQNRAQQAEYLRGPAASALASAPHEHGVRRVTAQEIQQREALLQHHANKEVERKERLRRRAPVSQRCLLCTLDLDDAEDTDARVRRVLEASNRNRGSHIPTLEALRAALSDPRRRPSHAALTSSATSTHEARLVCKARFVNAVSRTVQVVHPRCAHLCTAYQKGDSLEDIVYQTEMQVCTLCGMPGATVSCYHPSCREMYHVVCALFSNGYVNFGKRDPYMPCPACPRHTQVVVDAEGHTSSPRSGHEYVVQGSDPSCWEDGIVFDSRVVEDTDLRDPDENGGL